MGCGASKEGSDAVAAKYAAQTEPASATLSELEGSSELLLRTPRMPEAAKEIEYAESILKLSLCEVSKPMIFWRTYSCPSRGRFSNKLAERRGKMAFEYVKSDVKQIEKESRQVVHSFRPFIFGFVF